jgi:hypothetical protein
MALSLWGVPSALHVRAETACTCSQVGDTARQASYAGVRSAQSEPPSSVEASRASADATLRKVGPPQVGRTSIQLRMDAAPRGRDQERVAETRRGGSSRWS